MIALQYDFEECRFEIISDQFMPIELTAITAHGGIVVHRADDNALSIIMDGKVIPWLDNKLVLDCKNRRFQRDVFFGHTDAICQ